MDRFANMKTFTHVVEAGSISGAADRLNTVKSAVSRRLKELEEHLGVELFHRTTRRMNLTDSGRTFYQQVLRLLDDLEEAEMVVSQAHCTLKGRLKVALPSSFGNLHVGPAINDFLQLHEHIEFDLDFNDRQVDLMQEGFDLAIRIANLPDSSLIARRIAPINHVLCASPEYIHQHGSPQSLIDLQNHACLAYNLPHNNPLWHFIDERKHAHKITINPHLKASSGEFLLAAAINHQGITYLPSFIAYQALEQGELIPLLKQYTAITMNAYAVYPQTRYLSRRVRTFIDFLVSRFETTPYWDLCLQSKNP